MQITLRHHAHTKPFPHFTPHHMQKKTRRMQELMEPFVVGGPEYPENGIVFTEPTGKYLFAGYTSESDMIQAFAAGDNASRYMLLRYPNGSVDSSRLNGFMRVGSRADLPASETIGNHDTMVMHAAGAAKAVLRLGLIRDMTLTLEIMATQWWHHVAQTAGPNVKPLTPKETFIIECGKLRERMCAKLGAVLAHTIFLPWEQSINSPVPDTPSWQLLLGSQHAQYQLMYNKYKAKYEKRKDKQVLPTSRDQFAEAIKRLNADEQFARRFGIDYTDAPSAYKLLNRTASRLKSMISRHVLATVAASRSKSTKPVGGWVLAAFKSRQTGRQSGRWGTAPAISSPNPQVLKRYMARRRFDENVFKRVHSIRHPTPGNSSYLYRQWVANDEDDDTGEPFVMDKEYEQQPGQSFAVPAGTQPLTARQRADARAAASEKVRRAEQEARRMERAATRAANSTRVDAAPPATASDLMAGLQGLQW